MINPSNKFYIIVFVILFIIPTIILLISNTATVPAPAWGGYLDVGMWVYRDAFDFNILLPGVAWRSYFFLSILSYALHPWKSEQHP